MPRLIALLLLLVGWPAAALAAVPACQVPADLPQWHVEAPTEREPQRLLPIGGYTLSMIWTPQHCRSARGDFGCAAHGGFALHGLWPDGTGAEWPQWCHPAALLPAATVRAHYCATPSPQLLQHEWSKHGTCLAGATPESYLALSNRLFGAVAAPDMRALSYRRLTARDFAAAFAQANPGFAPEMVRLNLDRRGWLEEVWLCLDRAYKPQACPATQGGARGDERVMIWRGDGPAGGSAGRRYGYGRRYGPPGDRSFSDRRSRYRDGDGPGGGG